MTHRECEYVPCHKTADTENFNCLFCYCPLYFMGDQCGGTPAYNPNGVKDCSGCMLPHVKANYGYVVNRLAAAAR
ncbi:MAG: cysteine-rich small domain-containing protein [Clostridiales bacterium]|nr:cysteine-rich small domain-containing protein [Clostridiales bacterium]